MALGTIHRWWIVVLVSPFAFYGAVVVTGLLWLVSDSRVTQTLLVVFGAGWAYVGLTEPDRLGSVLMGIAFILIGLFSRRSDAPA